MQAACNGDDARIEGLDSAQYLHPHRKLGGDEGDPDDLGSGLLQKFPDHLRGRRAVWDQIVLPFHLQQADVMILQVGGDGQKPERRADQLFVDKFLRLCTGMGEDTIMGGAGRVD